MKVKLKIINLTVVNLLRLLLHQTDVAESKVLADPKSIKFTAKSPSRFNIMRNMLPYMQSGEKELNPIVGMTIMRSLRDIQKSFKQLRHNSIKNKTTLSPEEFQQLQKVATNNGVVKIGFTQLSPDLIFQDKAVMYDQAIVMAYEMDLESIKLAPSLTTEKMIHNSYNALGRASIAIADYLQSIGVAAHAGHPLGGLTLFPPLAQQAGLGHRGAHGLIITPEYGARIRLTAVFTNVTNFPLSFQDSYKWIEDYCAQCHICINSCPGNAIFSEPIVLDNGLLQHIDTARCFPNFATKNGCTICVKVCPFSKVSDVLKLKSLLEKRQLRKLQATSSL